MRSCLACTERPAEIANNLCDECAAGLAAPTTLAPEQVISGQDSRTSAALIDQWGRPHYLAGVTGIGRRVGGSGLAILDASVSRKHAEIAADGAAYTLRDCESTNGTAVADERIEEPTALRHGDRLAIGSVGFFFISPTDSVADLDRELAGETHKPEAQHAAISRADLGDDESTFAGLPKVRVELVEPTGGGGGYIRALGKTVQLTTTQFELVHLLAHRMIDEPQQPALVRGFVRSSELQAAVSWDTAHPTENHVKQLVRRVRRGLVRGEIGNLVESRHRFGYRLRIIPVFAD